MVPEGVHLGCTISASRSPTTANKIRMYEVEYFMASVDTVEENTKFAKATSVTLPGRGGAAPTVVEKKEADFPLLSDPTKDVATKYGVLNQAGWRVAGRSTSTRPARLPTSRRRSSRRRRPRTC